ncbi:MAG: TetR/AcrR family transcriptional regulator [Pseudomonadota bacterium]
MSRPRAFDQQELLDGAMRLFWARGYGATSVDDVVRATGVSRSSLYGLYPDKHALFIAALTQYLGRVTGEHARVLDTAPRAADGIRRFLGNLAKRASRPETAGRGCMLTNSAIESPEIGADGRRLVRQALERVQERLRRTLVRAQAEGDLAPEVDPDAYAHQLLALIQGLRVLGRAGMPGAGLRRAVESALTPIH